jgi:AraC family transcriptional activator of pobA
MGEQREVATVGSSKVSIVAIECPAGDGERSFDFASDVFRQYVFVHSGGGDAELDGWRTGLAAGEIAFIPAHARALMHFGGETRAILLGICEEFLLSRVLPALGVTMAPYWHDFHTPKKLSHWTSPAELPDRDRLWEELLRAERRLGTPGDAAVAAYVLLTLFEKNHIPGAGEVLGELPVANAVEQMPRSALDIVTRFRGLVERELASDWQINDYCRVLGVRSAQLTQACKELLGCTPISVVHEQKMMHAKRQLTYSNSSAAEIAYQLGFNDPAYFSRFFRRFAGKSPVEFRRSLGSPAFAGLRGAELAGGVRATATAALAWKDQQPERLGA